MIRLKGMAWNHTRGFLPMVATSQRFEELNPGVTISWEKRSLQAFADAPLDHLAARYDLIVMDHPHTAIAAREKALVPLDKFLPAKFMRDQALNSVGHSHRSYQFFGHQWALATDAAAPVAIWREDLLNKRHLEVPKDWKDVLALARNGHVSAPLFPVDTLLHLFMFCHGWGDTPFQQNEVVARPETLSAALETLRELASHCSPECLRKNPIQVAEDMTLNDGAAYCPFAYCYSNYSRPSYTSSPLRAGKLVTFRRRRLRSILGGAGLSVSARTKHRQLCIDYAAFVACEHSQRGLYFESGGQPGHRQAWLSPALNSAAGNFFKDALPTLDQALLRPAYPGYMKFQDEAPDIVHRCISQRATVSLTAQKLNHLYRKSRSTRKHSS